MLITGHVLYIVDDFVADFNPLKDLMKKLKMSSPSNLSGVSGGRADMLSKPGLCDFKSPFLLLSSMFHLVEFDFYKKGKLCL